MAAKRQITTMCPMNCLPTQCGMRVEVADNKLLTLKGDPTNPDSRGFLCIRGRATPEIFDNPKRLLHPLRRVGARGAGQWEECSWDDAYAMMVESISQTRPERVGLWRGHGVGTTGILSSLITRFGLMGGFQQWASAIVCWAMGGYGLGLTGLLETSTKEDMAANSRTILFWGSTLASQPGIAPHLIEARKRGAYVVHIDTRRTEISSHVDEVILLHPGSDAALALAIAHVITQEGLTEPAFIEGHTFGFAEFSEHVRQYTPEWAADICRIEPERIRDLARRYARDTPAMIVLGGSSMYKHQHGWEASRAIACLPALIGQLGVAGAGMGPRHGASTHSDGYASVLPHVGKLVENLIPSHMATIAAALKAGQIDTLLLLGSNILSSFADANDLASGLEQIKLIVSYDLFMNETSRRFADLILPGTAWLEDIGLKQTATHIYLMERALEPEGECRTLSSILRQLAERLNITDFFPWQDDEGYVNALLAAQRTESGDALTVDALRQQGGYWQKNNLSHIAYPQLNFQTPSGNVEFWSERARQAGLSALPSYTVPHKEDYPLRFSQGRTLTAFHAFFDEGQALPTLAKANIGGPELWMHPQDAGCRNIQSGSPIVIVNERGQFEARARVTDDILPGAVWMRDGWSGVNRVTSGAPIVELAANDIVAGIPGGQATYDAWVEVQSYPI